MPAATNRIEDEEGRVGVVSNNEHGTMKTPTGRNTLNRQQERDATLKANLPQVDREKLKAEGWTDEEIDAINLYCKQANAAGHFDMTTWPIMSPNGEIRVVCKTVALAVRQVRPDLPEVVIRQPGDGRQKHGSKD